MTMTIQANGPAARRGSCGCGRSRRLGVALIHRLVAEPLVINSYGGAFEKFMRVEIIPVFEKDTGIKTRLDIGLAKDLAMTLRAAGVDNPPYDVLMMNGIFAALLRGEGFFEPIPVAEVSNMKDLVPIARQPNDNGVIAWMQPVGVAYRSDMINRQPAASRTNPEFKGHLGLYTITNTAGMMFLLMIAKIFGGSEYKTDVAFDEICKLRPFTQVDFGGTMEIMLTRGEVTVGPLDFPAVARLKLKGVEIDIKPPAEGSFMFDQMFNMLKGSKKKAEGYKWIDFLLRPDIQQKCVKENFYVTPSSRAAEIPDELKPLIPLYGDRTKEIVVFDWDTANKNRDAIIDRWNKEMT